MDAAISAVRRSFARVAAILFLAALCLGSAHAEKRVALVLGNSAYRNAPQLPNPANDAAAVATMLKTAGFDLVEVRKDLGVSDMRRAIRDFSEAVRDADMAVVYYAGHGIEVAGSNYLVPTDATLAREIDVEDETVSLERILSVLEPAKRLRLVILDACRDNPFVRTMRPTVASRSIGRGLAKIEPARSGTLIAFAAKAGSIATDGTGHHSPFTEAVLNHIATPGLDVRMAFGRVGDQVMKSTLNRQEPFVYGSLGGAAVSLVALPAAAADTPVQSRAPSSDEAAARDYALAAQVGTQAAWDAFLAKHPAGFYADLARAQRAKLTLPATATVPTAPRDTAPAARKAAGSKQVKPEAKSRRAGPGGPSAAAAGIPKGECRGLLACLDRYCPKAHTCWNACYRKSCNP